MKTAGEILSGLFDKQFTEKAKGFSKFFDSWLDITEKNGIPHAAAYSRIKDLKKGIVIIELDHPGWKQILQTKQSKLLYDFRYRFPELDITGISLMLGQGDIKEEPLAKTMIESKQSRKEIEKPVENTAFNENEDILLQMPPPVEYNIVSEESISRGKRPDPIDKIKDKALKEKLKQLEQTIKEREKNC